jgi:hypothetical protein
MKKRKKRKRKKRKKRKKKKGCYSYGTEPPNSMNPQTISSILRSGAASSLSPWDE